MLWRFGFIPDVWPHQAAFPFRGRLLFLGCLLSTLAGGVSAGLPLSQRGLVFVVAFTGLTNGFFYGAIFIRLLGMIPVVGRSLLLLTFYACLVSAGLDIAQVLVDTTGSGSSVLSASTLWMPWSVSSALGLAAAAHTVINRARAGSSPPRA